MPKAAYSELPTTSHRPRGPKLYQKRLWNPTATATVAIKLLRALNRHSTLSQKLEAHDALESELRKYHDELLNELDAEIIPA